MQSGDTPLHFASREGLLGVAQSLCAFGCSVDLANNEGQQAIHLAAKNGHTEIVRCLCLAGSKCDVTNSDGFTPEAVAMASGHGDVCQLIQRLKKVRMTVPLSMSEIEQTSLHRLWHFCCFKYVKAFLDQIRTGIIDLRTSVLLQDSRCDEYIDQLIPSSAPIAKIKLKVFGDSSVGKSSLIESIKSGYFSGLFRRSSSRNSTKKKSKGGVTSSSKDSPSSPEGGEWQKQLKAQQQKARVDGGEHAIGGCPASPVTSLTREKKAVATTRSSDVIHEQYTKGISVHQVTNAGFPLRLKGKLTSSPRRLHAALARGQQQTHTEPLSLEGF